MGRRSPPSCIGSDCESEECLCLGIGKGRCHDCDTPIGEHAHGTWLEPERVPYFVQWRNWFAWRAEQVASK